MAIASFKRKEIKFLLDKNQYNLLIPHIEKYMNPDEYCIGGKEYGVYNIYFDTEDNYLIRESLSKPYYKEKFRMRSYFCSAKAEDTVFLEIKKKIGGVVAKRRVTLTLQEAEKYLNLGIRPANSKYIQTQVFDEIDAFLKRYDIGPKHYISYQRSAFFGKDDKNFRLTFDRNITERKSNLSLKAGNYGDLIIEPDEYLMEVKISDCVPIWLCDKLAELNIFKTSFSKYGKAYTKCIHDKIYEKKGEIKNYA